MALPYFFNAINPEIIVLGAFFFIFFAFINYTLSKVFRDRYGNVNVLTSAIISICISILIIYFGRNVISNLVEGLRLSSAILYVLSGVGVLVILYLLRKSLRFCMILMLVGAGLILVGALTDFFYQKWFVILFGALILIAGLAWCLKKKKNILSDALDPNFKRYAESPRSPRPTRSRKSTSLRRFRYSAGMRRGGLKPTRGRFVGRAATERYARRFGSRTARKRFKK